MLQETNHLPKQRPGEKFVHVGARVMLGREFICDCRSKTMAKRIANALNKYTPNNEGV